MIASTPGDSAQPVQDLTANAPKSDPKESFPWLLIVGALISAVTTVLALLGFGTALAVEARFGLPYASTFESAAELLSFAAIPLLHLLEFGANNPLDWATVWRAYRSSGSTLALGGAVITLLFGLFWLIDRRRAAGRRSAIPRRTAPIAAASRRRVVVGYSLTILSWLSLPVLVVLCLIGVVWLAALLALVPMVGMEAAKAHFDKWVIAPERCTPHVDRSAHLSAINDAHRSDRPAAEEKAGASSATCVELWRDDKAIASGRVVLSTSHMIVLYNVDTGAADRFELSDVQLRTGS